MKAFLSPDGGAAVLALPFSTPPAPGPGGRKTAKRRAARPRSLRTLLSFARGRYGAVTWEQFRFCWRHGFFPYRALDYDFDSYRPEDYFPDSIDGSPGRENAEVAACCEDKVVFALYMQRIGASTPEVLAENAGGRLIVHGGAEDFETLLHAHGELVVKPRDSSSGDGVRIVRAGDADAAPRPGEFATPRVWQAEYSAAIYPQSANTIRVLTAWDYDHQDVFIAAAAHRFGTALGGCVDNWTAGGLGVGIDLATGRLGCGIHKPSHDPSRKRWHTHPDTGAPIDGVVIPRFAEMCRDVERVARQFPRRYVGWDIVMTPEAWIFLEANRVPSLGLFQLHRPVLTDPRLREFFRREGVLRR